MEMSKSTILIHSADFDASTNDVLDWLYYNPQSKNFNIKRINGSIGIDTISMYISSSKETPASVCSFFDPNIKFYWYRRGALEILAPNKYLIYSDNFNHVTKSDYADYNKFLKELVPKGINNPRDNEINKLKVYVHAKQCGLFFPDTYILNSFSDDFLEKLKGKEFVVKSLSYPSISIHYKSFEVDLYSSTQLINLKDVLKIYPKTFLLSQFQEYIPKKYEIRTFYLNGIFKSMAIFSQQNEQTKVDFRNYDLERPNRCVPYNLPKWYETKLHELMLSLEINCGSIDTIVTPDDEFYFLEINPIGQFQWLSKNCNYFIERMIADALLH
jgi:ATP-GRASP peptide maturase of grasp-with-spasm system